MHPRLSEAAVREFQAICWDEFQVALTYEQAEQRAVEVLELFCFLFDEPASTPVPPPATSSISPKEQGQLF